MYLPRSQHTYPFNLTYMIMLNPKMCFVYFFKTNGNADKYLELTLQAFFQSHSTQCLHSFIYLVDYDIQILKLSVHCVLFFFTGLCKLIQSSLILL